MAIGEAPFDWQQAARDGWNSKWFQPQDGVASLQSDYVGVAALALAFPLVRYTLHKVLLQPLARHMLAGPFRSAQRLPDKLNSKINKFSESAWKFLVYVLFTYMAFAAAVHEPWFRDTSYFWRGYPNHPLTTGLSRLYCFEMAFYISSIGMLVFWETRRKDFVVMMTHHLATVVLIALSYHLNFTRVGCMILLLHDACDILMELAKMCKYLNQDFLGSAVFGLFMLAWILLRLVYFPVWILWSTSVQSTEVLGKPVPYYYLFNGLLSLLVLMHIYWFGLIAKIAWRALATGAPDDIREDSDED